MLAVICARRVQINEVLAGKVAFAYALLGPVSTATPTYQNVSKNRQPSIAYDLENYYRP